MVGLFTYGFVSHAFLQLLAEYRWVVAPHNTNIANICEMPLARLARTLPRALSVSLARLRACSLHM